MPIKLLSLILLFFAVMPNLGFFTPPAFLILSFIAFLFLTQIFKSKPLFLFSKANRPENFNLLLSFLLFFSLIYYGGLYQDKDSLATGFIVFFSLLMFTFAVLRFSGLQRARLSLSLIVVFYIFLSFWTIRHSPFPSVDVFVILKEAPRILLAGQNPYSSIYSQVYPQVNPDYYPYLPFSFIYTLPFVFVFSDPRYGVLAANLISVFLIYKLFRKQANFRELTIFSTTFLFLPGSFFILEHSYLDPVIFAFFLFYIFLSSEKRQGLSFFVLALFFSFKQYLLVFLPAFFNKNRLSQIKSRSIIFFLLPFLLPLYFFLFDPSSFLKDLVFFYHPGKVPVPISASLSLPTFLNYFNLISNNIARLFAGLVPLLILYLLTLKAKISLVFKLAILLFFFHYLLYHSFFNHYYLIAQLLLLDIGVEYFKIKL